MDYFYFFEEASEEFEGCFVLVENGEKLITVTPLTIDDEEQNDAAILIKKMKLKE